MTKNELIFTVMEAIRGQASTDDSGKFVHPQDVAYELSLAYDTVVVNFFEDPERAKNYDLDYFSKTYVAALQENTASGDLFVTLPAQPIGLPNGQGIRSLRPNNSWVQFVRVSEAEWMDLRKLESFCCSPWPCCDMDLYSKKIIIEAKRPE